MANGALGPLRWEDHGRRFSVWYQGKLIKPGASAQELDQAQRLVRQGQDSVRTVGRALYPELA